ncbi:acyltransferase family protein [Agromyces albus]|uniref:acyltransferase family protein n=1 Tax=Agromyces albus TaxID=205332 RepID=UPI0027D86C9E|nr:acyltransferase [Agromyces albus]
MEGLRAVAAVSVVVGHVKAHLSLGVEWGPLTWPMYFALNGLTLFFALSGFLLFRPFASALLTGERFPILGRYAVNRVLRIFPVYIVIVLLVSLVLGLAYTAPQGAGQAESGDMVGYMTDPLLLLTNVTMLQTLFPFSIKTGLGVAWSLTVELIFYIVMPLLALLAMSIRRRVQGRHSPILALSPAIGIFLIGMVGKVVKWRIFEDIAPEDWFNSNWGGNWIAVFARSFFAHADLFAFGMVAAVLVAAFETGRIRHELAYRFRVIAAVVGIGAAVGSIVVPNFVVASAFAVACGALIFFVAIPTRSARPGILARGLELRPVVYIGVISYSLYLWHVPVIWLVERVGWVGPQTPLGLVINIVVVLAITIAFASVTYYAVEKPALSLKKRTDRRNADSAPSRPVGAEEGAEGANRVG